MTPNPEGFAPQQPQNPNVALAGTLLAVAGVLGALYALISMAGNVLNSSGALASLINDPALKQQLQQNSAMSGAMASKAVGIIWGLVMLAANGVVVLGGLKMRASSGYQLAMAAAVIACVPCCFSGCCTITSLPAGIFALIMLTKPEVKAAFTP